MGMRFLPRVVAVLLLAPPASSQVFYETGFTYTLKGADAKLGFTDATEFGPLVIGQLGKRHITAINADWGREDQPLARRMIALAIDARRQRYPEETPYVYRGITDGGNTHWGEAARAEMCKEGDEYWTRNISL